MDSAGGAATQKGPIHIAGIELTGHHGHICALVNDLDEAYRVLVPFIQEGIDQNDKGIHVLDPAHRDEHCRRLARANVDVASAESSGALELRSWDEIYFRDGRFDHQQTITEWGGVLTRVADAGFKRTRLIICMEWALDPRADIAELMQCESQFNWVHRQADATICVYDLRYFSNAVITDVLRTHPTILMNGILQKNPLYVPPERFLPRYRVD